MILLHLFQESGDIMKKMFVALLAIILCGCGSTTSLEKGYEFVDDLDRSLTVYSVENTAALLGSFADVWDLAGGHLCAAPDDAWQDFEIEMDKDAMNLGHTKELSLENLFASKPDFVIASANTRVDMEWKDTLESSNIPTAYFDVNNFEDYLNMLKICTDLTGRSDLYEKHGLNVQKEIEDAKAKAQERVNEKGKLKVLYLRASSGSVRAKNSDGNVLGDMLAQLQCENIADIDDRLLENLSIEYIMEQDPDAIFVVPLGDDLAAVDAYFDQFVKDNPAWSTLSAVKNNQVYQLDKRLYNLKPNEKWGQAILSLEDLLNEVQP